VASVSVVWIECARSWDGIGWRFAVSMKLFVMRGAVDDRMVEFGVDCGDVSCERVDSNYAVWCLSLISYSRVSTRRPGLGSFQSRD
jgi:hypothetical protein